ncbi:MAG: flavin reductase [Oscillospiraceae bacterium]|nr:flavin reductase [Oscillospiraceae bacterium]
MLSSAMGKGANSGENIRRTGRAVLAVPGVSLREAVMAYGSASGGTTDKLKSAPVPLQRTAGIEIQIPEDTRVAFAVFLAQTVEAGGHYLYLCGIDKIMANESKGALFAWDGCAKAAPAQEKR